MTLPPLVDREVAAERLKLIFPNSAFDTVLSSPLAAAAVVAMLYVGAIVDDTADPPVVDFVWARPATVMQMSDAALTAFHSDAARKSWAQAEARSTRTIATLLEGHGLEHHPWYAANSRETLRDETWPGWRRHGAVRQRHGIPTNSSKPRWALTASFARLFDPELTGDQLIAAIEAWRDEHMDPGDVLRIHRANELARATHQTPVSLPGGGTRVLEPGVASAILKGVIEEWAPRKMGEPFVVAISEPGAKAWAQDTATLAAAGIAINVSSVLPDAIIVDIGTKPPTFWIVEAVASDGEVNEDRKADLLAWAADQYIDPARCEFLSAFTSRNSAPARKRLKDIASGTYVWFLDEPTRELAWYELA
jgi:hypothetical protein